jgi:hypothetical protein
MCFKVDGLSTSYPIGTLVNCAAGEKYLGIISASSGRMAGKQAQIMTALTSRDDSVTWAGLSKERSMLFATWWIV